MAGRGAALAALVVGSLLIACVPGMARPSRQTGHVRATTRVDDAAVTLAARLPSDVTRCVVARPARLPPARRAVFARVAHANPIAWLASWPIRAFASAEVRRADGARGALWLLRTEGTAARVRAALASQPHLALRWGGGVACRGPECAASAVREPDGVVRIEHAWPTAQPLLVGRASEGPCARLARAAPDAVEVSVSEGAAPGVVRESRVLRVVGARAFAEERLTTRSPAATQRVLRWLDAVAGDGDDGIMGDGVWRLVERVARGRTIVSRYEVGFDDLALRAADERRLADALREEHALAGPLPLEALDLRDAELVAAQCALRRAQVDFSRGAARVEAVGALGALLEAAHTAQPDDAEIARALVRFRLDEGAAGEAAAALAADMAARDPVSTDAWRLLEREGLAVAASPGLAPRLVRDAIAGPREAGRVAADASEARRAGLAYAWAEGAAAAGQRFDALAGSAAVRRVPSSTALSIVGLPAALVWIARLGAPDPQAPFAAYVLARTASIAAEAPVAGAGVAGAGDAREEVPRGVRIRGARGGEGLLFAVRSDEGLDALVALGSAVARALDGAGRAEVALAFVPIEAASFAPAWTLVLRGRVEGGALLLGEVSRAASSIDWDLVARTLAGPLAAFTQRFPLPALEVVLRDGDEARRAAERVVDATCSVEGGRVRCVAPSAAELGDAARAIAAPLLGTSPGLLWSAPSAPRARGAPSRRARGLPGGLRSQ